MKARRIEVAEARPFWAHPSQHIHGSHPDALPEHGVQYWSCGPICGVFHLALWPRLWMGHYGVKPEGWGGVTEPARAILRAFWDAEKPARIVGWTDENNRAALAFARRLGFVVDGKMDLPGGAVIMQGWTPWE